MEIEPSGEKFDTGLSKIRHEIKSRLVLHGLFGTVSFGAPSDSPDGAAVAIQARGRIAARSFNRAQVESCCLRVSGTVLSELIAMADELARAPGPNP